MATHSSILAWEIPWTEEPGRLQSMGSKRVGHNLVTKQLQQYSLDDYPTGSSCIALGVNIGFLAVGAVINNAAVNICTLFFWWTNAYISVGMYLEELENSWVWTRVLVDTA